MTPLPRDCSEAERWLAWLDGDRRDDGTRALVGTPYQAAQRIAGRLYELERALAAAQSYVFTTKFVPAEVHAELREVAQELVDVAAGFPQLQRYAGVAGSLDALRAVLDPDGQESQHV